MEKTRWVELEKICLFAHELEEKKLAHEAERLRLMESGSVVQSANGEARAAVVTSRKW